MKQIDNVNNLFGDDLKETIQTGSRLRIAASCFSIYAFEALREELSQIESLQFILTTPSFLPHQATDRLKKERREFHIPKNTVENHLYGTEFEVRLRNQLTQRAIAKECADWIRKKAKFRVNATDTTIQTFANVETGHQSTSYCNFPSFTTVDLGYEKGNAASNIVFSFPESGAATGMLATFNQLWADPARVTDVTQAICAHIESAYQENAPERLYFTVLYNLFHDFLQDIENGSLPDERAGFRDTVIWNKLFNFQKDAVTGIINKLETYNGCILADSVGLGKTFTALAVIKYYELKNQSVLVLCPRKLEENWRAYNANLTTNIFARDRFNYEVFFHTDLSRTSGQSGGVQLNRVNWGNYDLVVIDESHNFRNNDALKERETRYQKLLNKVIRDGVRTRVLMLSATPVNNRFSDLKNQLALAYEGDSENLSSKLKGNANVDAIFRQAQAAFNAWSGLPPEARTADAILKSLDYDFFELLDAVTIARSRRHIETFYDTTEIGKFPRRRKPISYHCPITERPDVSPLNAIVERLDTLKLAVYAPISYLQPSRVAQYEALYDTQVGTGKTKLRQADRERSLLGLMTTNILKRLESSVYAFRSTLENIQRNNLAALETIERFQSQRGEDRFAKEQYLDNDDDDFDGLEEFTTGKKVQIHLKDMDVLSWKHSLTNDRDIIQTLIDEVSVVASDDDAKLQHLLAQIEEKIRNPLNPGNQKVLIFTAFADTANYLYGHVAQLARRLNLHAAVVTGSRPPQTTLTKQRSFQDVLTLFSPQSRGKAEVLPNDRYEIDILIGTDCISEGQNLQDCDYLINYDIHWNPVRIIQRFGRIDRIGSPNQQIQLVNYWPDITLDEYINLKERVENRMVISDLSATGDDNVLNANANAASYRKEQLQRLQDEVIELEDLRTGISITDLGLNDFRMDLIQLGRENKDLTAMPKGMHAVVPSRREIGVLPGAIFVLRSLSSSTLTNQQNRLHPYYMVYIGDDGELITDHTQVKRLLDLVRASCKGRSAPLTDLCTRFNEQTDDGRRMGHYSRLLNQAIRSMIDVKEERDIDSLFSGGATTALSHAIQGLDDFELIAFLVIQDDVP